jgi:hypothetical protein
MGEFPLLTFGPLRLDPIHKIEFVHMYSYMHLILPHNEITDELSMFMISVPPTQFGRPNWFECP